MQLLQDSRDMRLDGGLGDSELIGDLLVEKAAAQHHQDPHLLRRERRYLGRDPCQFAVSGLGKIKLWRHPYATSQDFGNGLAYAFRRRRLGNESGSPEIERTADHMRILACRNDDHGNAWILRAQVHQARQPLYAGHAKIEQHQVALLRLLEEGDGLVESASLVDLEIFEITGQC